MTVLTPSKIGHVCVSNFHGNHNHIVLIDPDNYDGTNFIFEIPL